MKKILILFILSILLTSCFVKDPYKCLDYQGDKKCMRFVDGDEIIWEEKKQILSKNGSKAV